MKYNLKELQYFCIIVGEFMNKKMYTAKQVVEFIERYDLDEKFFFIIEFYDMNHTQSINYVYKDLLEMIGQKVDYIVYLRKFKCGSMTHWQNSIIFTG